MSKTIGDNSDELYGYLGNNISILERLDQCISTGSGYMGGTISVGFYDQTANENLVRLIIKAINNRKDAAYLSKTNELIGESVKEYKHTSFESTNTITKALDRLSNKLLTDKGSFSSLWADFIKSSPKVKQAFLLAGGSLKFLSQAAQKSYDTFMDLNKSGIALGEPIHNLYDYAATTGVKYENFIKIFEDNSEKYAKLSGAFGNGTEIFRKLTKTAADLNGQGIDLHQGLDAMLGFADRSAAIFKEFGYSSEIVNFESARYVKLLKSLSQMTGKQVSSLEEAVKAQERDNLMKMLARDPENQAKMAMMNALNIPLAVQEAILTGVPNAEYAQWTITEGNAEILNKINEHKFFEDDETRKKYINAKTDEEKEQIIQESIDDFSEEFIKFAQQFAGSAENALSFALENPAVFAAWNKSHPMLAGGMNNIIDIQNLNDKKNAKSDEEGAQAHNNLQQALNNLSTEFEQLSSVQISSFKSAIEGVTKALGDAESGSGIIGKLQKLNDIKNGKLNENGELEHPWLSKIAELVGDNIGTVVGGAGTLWAGWKGISTIKALSAATAAETAGATTAETAGATAAETASMTILPKTFRGALKASALLGTTYALHKGNQDVDEYYEKHKNENRNKKASEIIDDSMVEIWKEDLEAFNDKRMDLSDKFFISLGLLVDGIKSNSVWMQEGGAKIAEHLTEDDYRNKIIESDNAMYNELSKNLDEKMHYGNISNQIEKNIPEQLKIITIDEMSDKSKEQFKEILSSTNFTMTMEDITKKNLEDFYENISNKLNDINIGIGNVNEKLSYSNENDRKSIDIQYELSKTAKDQYNQNIMNSMDEYTNDSGKSFK